MSFEKVLSPIKVGSLTLKNRFVVPAMGIGMTDHEGYITQPYIDYWAARARGGFALCITEYAYVEVAPKSRHKIDNLS